MKYNITYLRKEGKQEKKHFEVLDIMDVAHHGAPEAAEKILKEKHKAPIIILKTRPTTTAVAEII